MVLKKVGLTLAKGLGIDVHAHERCVPCDLVKRATDAVHPYESFIEKPPTVKEWAFECLPSRHDIVPYLTSFFPFTKWIGRYNLRWFTGDVIAGVTLGLVVVPQVLSYSLLANLSPEYGLYTSFVGASIYWLFGTSKDISIGATAVVSLLVGKTGDNVLQQHPEFDRGEIVKTHAFLSGCFLLVFGLLRLDWIIEFIPHVAISAFVTGAAITISLSQLPTLLGIDGVNSRGPAYQVFIEVCQGLGRIKLDAAIGIPALLLLTFIKYSCEHMKKRQPCRSRLWTTLSSLRFTFTVLLFTLISFLVNRDTLSGPPKFRILGKLPVGFSHTGAPSLQPELITALLPQLPATVIILIVEHIAIGKSFGRINGYTVVPSQELMSIAATNMLGPFVGAYASTGSFGGAAILSNSGSRTPLNGVFDSFILLLALYALTLVLYYIPMAGLGALIIHAVINLIMSPDHLYKYWLMSPPDVVIYFVGVLVAVFTSLEYGIYATVALSAILLLLRLALSQGRFMGRMRIHRYPSRGQDGIASSSSSIMASECPVMVSPMRTREVFMPLDRKDASNPEIDIESPYPGIFIYRFTDGFNYLNQEQHIDTLLARVMKDTRRTTVAHYNHPGDRPWNEHPPPKSVSSGPNEPDPESLKPTLKAIVLDCSAINNMDIGSVEGLIGLRNQLDRWASPDPVEWHFASLDNRWARRALAAAGFGYPSVAEFERREHWDPTFSLAPKKSVAEPNNGVRTRSPHASSQNVDSDGAEKGIMGVVCAATPTLAPMHGINYPNFHIDLSAAVENAVRLANTGYQKPGAVACKDADNAE
ncbi:sulfate permease [Biscogniauxia mediterranea]|nr:sulfate permease [Biscogniauxia mediterranea]